MQGEGETFTREKSERRPSLTSFFLLVIRLALAVYN